VVQGNWRILLFVLFPIERLEIPLTLAVKIGYPEGMKALPKWEDVRLSPARIEVFTNHLDVPEKYL
jgi:hypothetical protein